MDRVFTHINDGKNQIARGGAPQLSPDHFVLEIFTSSFKYYCDEMCKSCEGLKRYMPGGSVLDLYSAYKVKQNFDYFVSNFKSLSAESGMSLYVRYECATNDLLWMVVEYMKPIMDAREPQRVTYKELKDRCEYWKEELPADNKSACLMEIKLCVGVVYGLFKCHLTDEYHQLKTLSWNVSYTACCALPVCHTVWLLRRTSELIANYGDKYEIKEYDGISNNVHTMWYLANKILDEMQKENINHRRIKFWLSDLVAIKTKMFEALVNVWPKRKEEKELMKAFEDIKNRNRNVDRCFYSMLETFPKV